MKILIAEDNLISSRALEISLQKEGYETMTAHTGKETLESLRGHPEIQLIIADIMMPEMDGLEVLKKMRETPEWKEMPVIITTALSDLETVKKAASFGCKHYIVKPIKMGKLIQKVREALKNEKPVLCDRSEVMSELGLNLQSYTEIARIFVAFLHDKISQLEKELAEGPITLGPVDLANIFESASLMKAEKLKTLQNSLEGRGFPERDGTNSIYSQLLKEMKILFPFVLNAANCPLFTYLEKDWPKENQETNKEDPQSVSQ